MIKIYRYWTLLVAALIFFGIPGNASAKGSEEDSRPLCLPGFFYDPTQDCNPFGPTAYLLEMAEIGFTFPETPLPVKSPDPTLSEVEFKYAYVLSERAPIYLNLSDAVEENKSNIV
ncbi:MAG TPA: hypothetical protein ENF27_02010, partial [Chloroflexi bacterium]|nr:hypothetical protein [Chloroflexota bacterium]